MQVILRVTEFKASLQWAKAAMNAEPVGDILYAVQIPETGYTVDEEGRKIFNTDGIQHILSGMEVALIRDSDNEF